MGVVSLDLFEVLVHLVSFNFEFEEGHADKGDAEGVEITGERIIGEFLKVLGVGEEEVWVEESAGSADGVELVGLVLVDEFAFAEVADFELVIFCEVDDVGWLVVAVGLEGVRGWDGLRCGGTSWLGRL